MKENVKVILDDYLKIFPKEKVRLSMLEKYIEKYKIEEIIDWNNKDGHLTVGAFVYCKKEDKFLVLYHKDLKMYLCPGGHVDKEDATLYDASKRELKEETGLENLKVLLINNKIMPFDIDIHLIPFNKRINMPEHYHFDFRYLFFVNDITDIIIDEKESKGYKWVTSDQLVENYGNIVEKNKRLHYVVS